MSAERKIQVGEHTLIVRPLPYGRLKRVIRMVMDGVDEMKLSAEKLNNFEFVKALPEVVDKKLPALMCEVFDAGSHPFLNPEWIDNNVTMPQLSDILNAILEVNQVNDFLGRRGPVQMAPKISQAQTETLGPETATVTPIATS